MNTVLAASWPIGIIRSSFVTISRPHLKRSALSDGCAEKCAAPSFFPEIDSSTANWRRDSPTHRAEYSELVFVCSASYTEESPNASRSIKTSTTYGAVFPLKFFFWSGLSLKAECKFWKFPVALEKPGTFQKFRQHLRLGRVPVHSMRPPDCKIVRSNASAVTEGLNWTTV